MELSTSEWAKHYSVPRQAVKSPSSVASVQLFSTAGDVISDDRRRLLPERVEQLIFLQKNMPLILIMNDS